MSYYYGAGGGVGRGVGYGVMLRRLVVWTSVFDWTTLVVCIRLGVRQWLPLTVGILVCSVVRMVRSCVDAIRGVWNLTFRVV